jgi:hypothetical protein
MKHILNPAVKCYSLFSNLFLCHKKVIVSLVIIALSGSGYAQTSHKDLSAFYSIFDPKHSKTGFILNKGFASSDRLWQSSITIQKPESFVVSNVFKWKQLYRSLQLSEVAKGTRIFPELSSLLLPDEKTELIPIGIIHVDGEYLDPELIPKYYDASQRKLKPSAPYTKLKVFSISNLKGEAHSGRVTFAFDPQFHFSNSTDQALGLEIDFGDGSGYRNFSLEKQTIPVTYSNIGEHSIRFKLRLSSGTLLSYSKISIKSLTRVDPSVKGRISASKGAASRAISGGNYEIYYGCDGVLDRPVIIVEGFDPLQNRQISSLFNDYNESGFAQDVMAFGYDIVILKFSNNHDLIENNAQVLKTLITELNTLKTGHFENIVIGESMGGLVSRIALAQMEADNIDHEVGLYISFDSPQKGANIPIGTQEFVADAMDVDLVEVLDIAFDVSLSLAYGYEFVDLTLDMVNELVDANNSPATRQMLIRHRDHKSVINPDYLSFQNFLSATGYPADSRNIALINGSNNGAQQASEGGDGVLNLGEQYINKQVGCDCCGLKVNADIWVSPVNTTAKVSDLEIRTQISPFPCVLTRVTDKEGVATFDHKPWDISPGGTSTSGGPDQDQFSFVPTVSSIDLDNSIIEGTNGLFYFQQFSSDLARRKAQLIGLNQTPFDDIWSGTANTTHVDVNSAPFGTVQLREIMPQSMYLQNKTIPEGRKRDYKAATLVHSGNNVTPSAFGGKIIQQQDFIVSSGSEVSFTAGQEIRLLPGFHVISGAVFLAKIQPNNSCVVSGISARKATAGEDTYMPTSPLPAIQISQSENAATFDITNYEDDLNEVTYSWTLSGDNFELNSGTKRFNAADLKDGQYTVYASANNRVASKVFQVANNKNSDEKIESAQPEKSADAVRVYPNPSSKELAVSFENDAQAGVRIYMTDLNGKPVKILSDNVRAAGNYTETFDVSSFPSGVYFLVIEKENRNEIHKVIIIK